MLHAGYDRKTMEVRTASPQLYALDLRNHWQAALIPRGLRQFVVPGCDEGFPVGACRFAVGLTNTAGQSGGE